MPGIRLALYILVFLSGIAGLAYQMVWSRMLAVALGHEITAVLAVIAAFFVGLALGAFALNQRIRRAQNPQHWYAAIEILIGLWALLLIAIIPQFNTMVPKLIGSEPTTVWHWGVGFGSTLFLLLPATAAMGATLPAMERLFVVKLGITHRLSALYATNTLGAVVGVLGTAFFILPKLGMSTTLLLFALVNMACGLAVLWLSPRSNATISGLEKIHDVIAPVKTRFLSTLFFSGFLGLGYEVLVVRVLSQVLENTIYSFAAILSIYLLGTASGAALYHATWSTMSVTEDAWRKRLAQLLLLTSLASLLGIAALWITDTLYRAVLENLGTGMGTALLGELSVALVVFFIPTLVMGALFCHLAQRAVVKVGLGAALGVNTLGAALAPLFFGVIALPLLGAKLVLVILALGYLVFTPPTHRKYWLAALAPASAAAAIVLAPLPLRFVATPPGAKILVYEEGVTAAVAVVEDADGHRHLKVNNHFTMGGTATRFSDHRQSHLPLLLHGEADSALYLGLGTGVTFEAARFYPELQTTGVELIPEMLPLMAHFDAQPTPEVWPHMPKILAADARRFVLSSEQQFDVIIAEVFHPSRDGAGSLYTREHFQAIRERLTPGGLFCQWLPLFQLDLATLKIIIRTFLDVFPHAQLHLAHFSLQQPILCLLGSEEARVYSEDWLVNRVHHRPLQQQLIELRLNSDFALFGGFLGGRNALAHFAGEGPLNTDNHPLVTYTAPHFVYGNPGPAATRLVKLTDALRGKRNTLLGEASSENFHTRLDDYWHARDAFLKAGLDVVATEDLRRLIATTRDPLLDVVRISQDFTPAYRPLLGMAQALYDIDRGAAFELLTELDAANPHNATARQLRHRYFGQ